ncbi:MULTISPECIES: ArsA family ATPase [Halorussus]|uniref:ArsA family ATPase n=1 Tax=Halorussus TaxID=1070314 RepID=UPI0020A01193|nr:ArsA family ATPase [Halorussus vallis]USZ77193.1 ArsA family ATPase [Halorussus vallis]
MERFVCYGGKGGVGKTTCAAATGLALAERGERTLVVSTDPAHSLADAFDAAAGEGRRRVAENLWIDEVGPDAGERAFRGIVEAMAVELREAGIRLDESEIERLFTVGVVPGSDELAALELLAQLVDDDEFDRVVVDTAPTGHTLRLLDLPDVLHETVAAASSLRGQVRRMVDGARSAVFGPAYYVFGGDDEAAEDDLTELRERMERVRDALRDPERSEFRVVCIPEPMAVAETRRLVARLREAEIPVGTLVVNRVATDPETDCERCRARAASHREQLERIREEFADLEVVELPEVGVDAAGRERLAALARSLAIE